MKKVRIFFFGEVVGLKVFGLGIKIELYFIL